MRLFACLNVRYWRSSFAPHPLQVQQRPPTDTVWKCVCKLRLARAASRGPQWVRSSGIPRDVTPGWRYASLNRSYCNLFSVQRGFFSEVASHCLHLFGKLKTTHRHAGDHACATAGLFVCYKRFSLLFLLLFFFSLHATACFVGRFSSSGEDVVFGLFVLSSFVAATRRKCHVNLGALSSQFGVSASSLSLLTVLGSWTRSQVSVRSQQLSLQEFT